MTINKRTGFYFYTCQFFNMNVDRQNSAKINEKSIKSSRKRVCTREINVLRGHTPDNFIQAGYLKIQYAKIKIANPILNE